ncbi:acyl-ACP desaturase [Rhodococcus sp. NPDC058521]|uniref:acyl-ACP desaturase n=1 Tax=Rhodococcus sp. NPDC058521 TaxID=3346536 RepID=UPI00364FDCA7
MSRPLSQVQLLRELQPDIERNLARLTAATDDLHPGDHLPAVGATPVPTAARSAMITSFLTTPVTPAFLGRTGHRVPENPWSTWLDSWTAAKNGHIAFLREHLVIGAGVDATALDRARANTMPVGIDSSLEGANLLHWVAHVTLQEMAAAVLHRNAAQLCGPTPTGKGLARIAEADNLHMRFYRDMCGAAFELAPDQTIKSVADVVMNFQMPGSTIPGIRHHTSLVVEHRIYDRRHHADDVVGPVLQHWNIFERNDLTAAGERARDRIATFVDASRCSLPATVA